MISVWSESCKINKRDSLDKDKEIDIAIIGAGMAGILTAYMLKEIGFNVVIIERRNIAGGVTKNTTAKITSQHNLIYNKLINNFGYDKAFQYARANQEAINNYINIINKKNIDCDFEQKPSYVYSLDNTNIIEKELEATLELGIDSEIVGKSTLPFDIKCAIKFNNQAQFNPLKFIDAISKDIVIYENTTAKDIKNNIIVTDKGNIKAKLIIVTTHFPFINTPGYYFIKMYQQRSYVIAIENANQLDGMYIDYSDEGFSFRNYKNLLLLGGAGHRTGKNSEGDGYEKLREAAKQFYPIYKEKYCWSTQDCMSLDGIPYIGHYSSSEKTIYVATGFNKWGMTNSMVSAMIISDMISGKDNNYKEVFSPQRFNMIASIKTLGEDSIEAISGFTNRIFKFPKENSDDIDCGHGGIVEYDGDKVGVYKDEKGNIFIVDIKCPHMGCQLEWNKEELSWDCPCHGSRFNFKGELLDGPSIKSLENHQIYIN